MMKTCGNCEFFKNNTCVNEKSEYKYQSTKYDVCILWVEKTNK